MVSSSFVGICLSFLLISSGNAFSVPSTTFVSPASTRCSPRRRTQHLCQQQMLPSFLLADEFENAVENLDAAGGASSFLDGLKSVGLAITAILFLGVGLTYITASFLIPKAAEQLETETKRLRPELWDEFQAKLEEGEVIAMRPDLLKELGDIMQPIIVADMEAQAGQIESENEALLNKLDEDETQLTQESDDSTGAIDAEIVDTSSDESADD